MTDAELLSLIKSDADALGKANQRRDGECRDRLAEIVPASVLGPIDYKRLLIWSAKNGVLTKIYAGISDPVVGGPCQAVLILMQTGGSFDPANGDNQTMIGGLIQAGILTQAQAQELASLGLVKPTITTDDVSRVLATAMANGKSL